MENEKILKLAIEKAIKNGYDFPFTDKVFDTFIHPIFGCTWIESVIFSHAFAKAFWKDEDHICDWCGPGSCRYNEDGDTPLDGWKVHLLNMVLEENRLKYLEKFLH